MTDNRPASVALAEILGDVRSGFASGDHIEDGVLQFRMNNVDREGVINFDSQRRVSPESVSDELQLQPGEILFNATNSPDLVGKTALFKGRHEPVTFSNHFLRLKVRQKIAFPDYIAHYLKWCFSRGTFQTMSRRWVNQATVNRDQLLSMPIPLPALEEQRRIAAILDQAEALRAKRRQALAKLDTLAQSLFLEMFGDPSTNPKGWEMVALGEIGNIITGNTPSRASSGYFGAAVDWVKSDNVNTPHYYVTRSAEGLSKEGKKVGRTVPAGSILVTCIAGSPSCIGNAAMSDREVAFNQQLNAIVPLRGDPHFLYAQVIAAKSKIQEASTKGMKGIVTKSRFEMIPLMFPPLALQEGFSRTSEKLRRMKERAENHLASTNNLVASLQHRAFRGEL